MARRLLSRGRKVIHCIEGERLIVVWCGILYRIPGSQMRALLCITTNETHLQPFTDKACNNKYTWPSEAELKSLAQIYVRNHQLLP